MTLADGTPVDDLLKVMMLEKDSQKKGKMLEDFVCDFFQLIPGLKVIGRNIFNSNSAQEIDVVFWNDRCANGLPFLESLVFMECKNIHDSLPARDVGWFVDKLAHKAQKLGVLVSLSGISGKAENSRYGRGMIVDYMKTRGVRLLTLDKAEILAANEMDDIVQTLKKKLLSLTIYETSL